MSWIARDHSSTGLYYGFIMIIINLPIDVTVAKKVIEKRLIEEECLKLLGKKLPRNTEEEQLCLRKVFQLVIFLSIRL